MAEGEEGGRKEVTGVCLCVEAVIRFLKAKLKVMQEEMDHMCEESNSKVSLLIHTNAEY